MTARSFLAILAGVIWLVAIRTPLEADDPVSSNVSFNREVIRIIQRKCEPCHAPDGLAMSLSDYRDARTWGRAIREELVEHRMPPATVARGYRRYESDPTLNAREMATFLTWLDGGMPRGDDVDRPQAAVADAVSELDSGTGVQLSLPPQTIPAGRDLIVRRVTIDAGAAAGRSVARLQVRPGNRRVLRGALVFASSAGSAAGTAARSPDHGSRVNWIGAWLPWQHAIVPPAPHAFDLPPDAKLTVELYYQGGDVELNDRSHIELAFAPDAATGVDDLVLDAREASGSRVRGVAKLPRPAQVWAIQATPGTAGESMELRAERPDKSFEVLMWVPKTSIDWPVALVLEEPVTLPAGSTLSLVASSPARAIVSILSP